MDKYFVVVTEQNTVFGLRDWFGLKLAWVFDDRDVAQDFIGDIRTHTKGGKVTSFSVPTEDQLKAIIEKDGLYPFMNPEMQVCLTDRDEFFPCIKEDAGTE
jgi:hypothetical protein